MKRIRNIGWLLGGLAASVVSAADLTVVVTDNDGNPVKDAVVFLKSDALIAKARPLSNIEMAQENREFVPGLQVVTTGTAVSFPNRDDVRHHVYSFSPAKTFELKLYSGSPEEPVVFDQEGIVELGCNIHDSMLAWILVTSTPAFAKTDVKGNAVFQGYDADQYDVDVWHRSFPYGAPFASSSLTLGEKDTTHKVEINAQEVWF